MEIFSACLALGIQYLMEITSIENLMEVDYKDYLDYAVCALSLIQFARFFYYYLVIASVSRMLLTLVGMIVDCIPFIGLLGCIWLIMTQLFFTFFQDKTTPYNGFLSTFQKQFLFTAAAYDYLGMKPEYEFPHLIAVIFVVYILNVVLLNFLVAIMSTTYAVMTETGSFLFKVN